MAKNINEAFTQIIENWADGKEFYTKLGTVKNIDISNENCIFTSNEGDTEIECLLYPSKSKIQIIPKENSLCIVGFSGDNEPYILLVQEFETIIYNEGKNKGLVKVVELTKKMNKLEDKINSLIDKYNNHIHITTATVGPTAVPGTIMKTTNQEAGKITNTKVEDIENEKIKH